jgi:hypothetical protein
MTSERRNGDRRSEDQILASKLDDHITRFDQLLDTIETGGLQLPNGMTMMSLVHDHANIMDVVAEYKASNGGVNARVKWTPAQKVALWMVGIPAMGSFIGQLVGWASG